MNQDLAEMIRVYTTQNHQKLNQLLLGKSQDNLISILVDLMTMYINDKNSSTIREFITVQLAGYQHSEKKIGFNGYKHDVIDHTKIECEAKPKNYDTSELEKFHNKERKTQPAKLDGGGNFTDYTFERLEKDKNSNANMLVSGFVDGKLIYILEFPLNIESFTDRLYTQLLKRFPDGQDKTGQYLRSASFTYEHYIKSKKLKNIFLLEKDKLNNYQKYFNQKFFQFLLEIS